MRTASISVVIPAFNEERRIRETIREVADYFSSQDEYVLREIIVVDDGSSDGTYRLTEELKVTVGRLVPVRHVTNQGKGEAVRSGVLRCSGDFILFTDVDLSTPLRETGRLFEKIKDGFDIAIASRGLSESRLVIKQPAYREMSGRLFNLFVQLLFLPGIWDTQCGFKLFTAEAGRKVFAVTKIKGFAFDVEFLYLARKLGYRIAEVPVEWSDDPDSRVRMTRDPLAMVRDLLGCFLRASLNGKTVGLQAKKDVPVPEPHQ